MTDAEPAPPPPTPPIVGSPDDDKTLPLAIYILYLAGFVSGGVTTIVGLVLAYVNKDTAPDWLKSHYIFQIRTFWISLLYGAIGAVLLLAFGLGVLVLTAVVIWFIVRCAMGLNWLMKGQGYPTPQSWTI